MGASPTSRSTSPTTPGSRPRPAGARRAPRARSSPTSTRGWSSMPTCSPPSSTPEPSSMRHQALGIRHGPAPFPITLLPVSVALIAGSAGLIGSEAVDSCIARGHDVVGIDNDMRRRFFGDDASTAWQRHELERRHGRRYQHVDLDIRDADGVARVVGRYGRDLHLVIHTAAQPSHDWAAREPFTDFGVNAVGTLNLLEACRQHAPDTVFVFTSTNKVYGDTPNRLPLVELETRWEIEPSHRYANGIDESMSIDQSTHSLFGASKVAADVLVQE